MRYIYTATVVLLAEFIRDQMNALLAGATGEGEIIIFGTLLVVIMVFMPEGLVARENTGPDPSALAS